MKSDGYIYIQNTSQGKVALNCSYREGDNLVSIFHDVLPARQCITGAKIPIDDWNRVKNSEAIKALIETGILLPEKKKVTIDQETRATSVPVPTGELAQASLDNLIKGNEAEARAGSRKAKLKLKG